MCLKCVQGKKNTCCHHPHSSICYLNIFEQVVHKIFCVMCQKSEPLYCKKDLIMFLYMIGTQSRWNKKSQPSISGQKDADVSLLDVVVAYTSIQKITISSLSTTTIFTCVFLQQHADESGTTNKNADFYIMERESVCCSRAERSAHVISFGRVFFFCTTTIETSLTGGYDQIEK